MIFKIIFIVISFSFLLTTSNAKAKQSYDAKGFAYIYNDLDFKKKIVSRKFNNDVLTISHPKIKFGSKIMITNPRNNKSLIFQIKKKSKYPKFYKVLLTLPVAKKLDLDLSFPYVEIQQIKKNKSFIAKKAVTHYDESKVKNIAPITKIKINKINIEKKLLRPKKLNFSISIAQFYSKQSALALKDKLSGELTKSSSKLLKIYKREKNNYELLMGSYNTISTLRNDYTLLTDAGFEELDIKIND